MIIDFHTHSHASDGALSPEELLRQAIAAGVQRLAITDHDTVRGYLALKSAASPLPAGFQLVPGVELSCVWRGVGVHVVGLDMAIDDPGFAAGLNRLDAARDSRAVIIAERLAARGMTGALAGARAAAGVSQIGRPHFGAWMVEQGHAKDLNQAFDRYLGAGKIGDVKTCWPDLDEVAGWIADAGGSAILAHPLKYKMTRTKLRALLGDFCKAGGTGMEVYSGRQTREQTQDLCRLAREFRLVASVGSDFHASWEYGPDLGVDTSQLPDFVDLWEPRRFGDAA